MWRECTDQLGKRLKLHQPPMRIVSLVPSQTELLFKLGLDEHIVGITKFCIHPAHCVKTKTKVGGTKNVKIDELLALNPDLVIANKEENTASDIAHLESKVPVWTSDVRTLSDAIDMILRIGHISGTAAMANEMAARIEDGFDKLKMGKPFNARVLYLIWKNPYMAAGQDTFINEMLRLSGFENVITSPESRYPEITVAEINSLNPDFIFLSSEPFPFKGKQLEAVKSELPIQKLHTVDGEAFSWYGSRLLQSIEYLQNLRQQLSSLT